MILELKLAKDLCLECSLTYIVQFIVYSFNHRSFARHYLIALGQQTVFHVVAKIGNQVYIVYNNIWVNFSEIYPITANSFPNTALRKFSFSRVLVIYISLGYGKFEYFAFVIDDNMELKSTGPTHFVLSY